MTAKRGRGRQSAAAEAQYQKQVAAFCKLILQIRSSMDFADQRSVRSRPCRRQGNNPALHTSRFSWDPKWSLPSAEVTFSPQFCLGRCRSLSFIGRRWGGRPVSELDGFSLGGRCGQFVSAPKITFPAASLAGILVGAFLLGGLSDYFGRKTMFIWEMIIFCAFLALLIRVEVAVARDHRLQTSQRPIPQPKI